MAHGILHGWKHGWAHGWKHDALTLGGDPMAGVTRDATSGIYCPATISEWNTTFSAAGLSSPTVTGIWGFQEASGNVADLSGNGFTLTAGGGATYQVAVTGWTRKAITYADASAAGLTNTAAGLPDTNTTSWLALGWIKMPAAAPAGTRNLIQIGTDGANRGSADGLNTGVARGFISGNAASGASNPFTDVVRPVVLALNQTADTFVAATDQDKMVPTFSASITGKGIRYNGSASSTSIAGGSLYGAAMQTELTTTQLKTLLQTLGWTIAWAP